MSIGLSDSEKQTSGFFRFGQKRKAGSYRWRSVEGQGSQARTQYLSFGRWLITSENLTRVRSIPGGHTKWRFRLMHARGGGLSLCARGRDDIGYNVFCFFGEGAR